LDKVNQEVMETGVSQVIEEPAAMLDGTQGIFLSNKVPLRNKMGEIIGLLGISMDITNLKSLQIAKEKAELASKQKSDFIHNMEHDIRTPFNGVYALARILAEQETDPTKKDRLEKISKSGKELLDYCNAVLDFSNIEAGGANIRHKRFDLKELLSNIITMEGATVAHKNLKLTLNYSDNIPHILIGDDIRIQRIMLNLMSNAIKFTEIGGVKIIVSLAKEKPEQREVVLKIVVEDTGIGISDDKKDIIFEKFTRLSPSNKGKYKGMGLGLYVVKQFMNDLNADIDLISAEGKGTAFICTIPFKLPLENVI
jgi:signal transduction histidine kinase